MWLGLAVPVRRGDILSLRLLFARTALGLTKSLMWYPITT